MLQNSAGMAQAPLLAHSRGSGGQVWISATVGMKRLGYCVPPLWERGVLDGALLLGYTMGGLSASSLKSKLYIKFFLTPNLRDWEDKKSKVDLVPVICQQYPPIILYSHSHKLLRAQ